MPLCEKLAPALSLHLPYSDESAGQGPYVSPTVATYFGHIAESTKRDAMELTAQ